MHQYTDFLRHLSILKVWDELGGGPVKHGRAKAFWRQGDGWSVSLDAEKNCWYDFRAASGGGILALVETVLGCSPREALRWVRDFAGVPVSDDASQEYRRRWLAAIPEGRAMAAWFERILEGVDQWHLVNFRLYHYAKRCILNGRYASDEELCALMDEAEQCEAEWQLAERVRDVLRAASADDLLVIFRAEAKSAKARTR